MEMQRGKQAFFRERSVFYTSRLIQEQLISGTDGNTFDLPEVYLIAILEFTMDDLVGEQYLHDICLMDKDTGAIFYKKLGYKFLELPNFTKAEFDLRTDLDRWFFLLKNLSRMDKVPLYFDKRVFQKLFEIAEVGNLTKEELMLYERSLKEKWDYENVLAYAVQEAEEKGAYLKALETARNLKALDVSAEVISKGTGLSIEEIAKL